MQAKPDELVPQLGTALRDAAFGDYGAGTSWVDGRPMVSRKVVAPRSVSDLPVNVLYEA